MQVTFLLHHMRYRGLHSIQWKAKGVPDGGGSYERFLERRDPWGNSSKTRKH